MTLGALAVFIFIWGMVWGKDISQKVTYQGSKARIAVGEIKNKASECDDEMAASIGEMLSTALANDEKFIVLASQEEVQELKEEIELGESGMVEEGKGPEKGLMEGADILITGAVTAFEPEAGGKGGALSGLKNRMMGEVGVQTKTAEIGMDIKLIDIRTRRIIRAISLEAKSTSWGADVAGATWVEDVALAGALGTYSNTPMEKAIRSVLAKAVDRISKDVPEEYYRYQGKGQYTKEYGSKAAPTGQTQGGEQGVTTPSAGSKPPEAATSQAPAAEDMALYTKYDFVPGDKVIFYDDLAGEEVGEFPSRWNLEYGVFEVARLGQTNWIMCTDKGYISPKVARAPLPDKYTVEMEIYDHGPEERGHWFRIHWVDTEGHEILGFHLQDHSSTGLTLQGNELASKELPNELIKGIHVMRIMATKSSIKCYVDNERVANVPKVDGFEPVGFKVYSDPWKDTDKPLLFGRFRFAEGGKSMREQLDETGRIVTHGILFDSGSYKIKAESYKTLSDIGQLLTDDPGLKLSIDGHTDSDGPDDYNMTLSQNRAESVRGFLVANHKIDSSRLQAKGWGESKPIDTNSTPEGKANNRRVELVKL
jgi:curli biogenesis system outer membrane secretion channel CsgG